MSDLISRQAALDLVRDICLEIIREYGEERQEANMVFECNKKIRKVLREMPSADPEPSQVARDIATIIENEQDMRVIAQEREVKLDEWCDTCKEYDRERHCCPRWNRVIRETMNELTMTEEKAIDYLDSTGWMVNHDRILSTPHWIPVTVRLPEEGQVLAACGKDGNAFYISTADAARESAYAGYVKAWMQIEPWKDGSDYDKEFWGDEK